MSSFQLKRAVHTSIPKSAFKTQENTFLSMILNILIKETYISSPKLSSVIGRLCGYSLQRNRTSVFFASIMLRIFSLLVIQAARACWCLSFKCVRFGDIFLPGLKICWLLFVNSNLSENVFLPYSSLLSGPWWLCGNIPIVGEFKVNWVIWI